MSVKAGECRHPDCIYRNKNDPVKSGQCNYLLMTGHARITGLPPKQQEPRHCPRYEPDGSAPKKAPGGTSWREEAERLFRAGATDGEIAEAVGHKRCTIQKWRRQELGEDPNPDKPASRFSWEWARELYQQGLNDREIAEKLGCSVASVWRWRTKYELFPHERERKENGNEDQGFGEPVQ